MRNICRIFKLVNTYWVKSRHIIGILRKREEYMKLYDDKEFIGKVIKLARKRANLTQGQFSEILDMSEKNLGNIENGKQFPQVNNFLRIMEKLNLSLNDFGVDSNLQQENIKRKELLKQIYLANEQELNTYQEILLSIKKINKYS